MKHINRIIWINLLAISFFAGLYACNSPTVSISVTEMRSGGVEIDDKPIDFYATRIYSDSRGDSLYYLKLNKGGHQLRVLTNKQDTSDTIFNVNSGESYIGINLETGEILL